MIEQKKFRAWDKTENKMSHWATIELWHPDDFQEMFRRPEDSPFQLLQFTNLNDEKGVEIYEGDVVDFPRYKTEILRLVVGKMTGRGLEVLWSVTGNLFGYWHSVHRNTESIVVGNIYENPELGGAN